jgi:glycosyltransferase involved in cell wall biosynthesis
LLHPTLGENFGHSIVEALWLGVPVLISDRAPWTNVQTFNAGWSLPLTHPQAFAEKLRDIYAMGDEWLSLSEGAIRYAHASFDRTETADRYRTAYG